MHKGPVQVDAIACLLKQLQAMSHVVITWLHAVTCNRIDTCRYMQSHLVTCSHIWSHAVTSGLMQSHQVTCSNIWSHAVTSGHMQSHTVLYLDWCELIGLLMDNPYSLLHKWKPVLSWDDEMGRTLNTTSVSRNQQRDGS